MPHVIFILLPMSQRFCKLDMSPKCLLKDIEWYNALGCAIYK